MNEKRDAAPLDERELELAALYALSALSGAEMEELEREHRGRRPFWDEVRSLRDAAAGLAEAGPRLRPGRDLWPEISARVGVPAAEADEHPDAPAAGARAAHAPASQPWKHWTAAPPSDVVLQADEHAFEPTDIEGISVRCLFVDERADRVTMLVRMAPGAAYPAHRHGGAEECYVLRGDLAIGPEIEMHAGDYQRMDAGSGHPVQTTRGGCLLLITSSRQDELLG